MQRMLVMTILVNYALGGLDPSGYKVFSLLLHIAVGILFFAFLLLAYSAVRGEAPRFSSGPRIGVLELKGEIGAGLSGRGRGVDADESMRAIKRFIDDTEMKAVVVRIDSPGGSVAPSQEIYDELKKLAEKKIVVCSLGNVAASGGFYIAMACPVILAEPGTLTGSIGVISQFPNVKGLIERFNVKVETLKSGKLKDSGNPFRDMTPEDRVYWQSLIDQVYAMGYLNNFDWGCKSGVHSGWAIIEAEDENQARLAVPSFVRSKARVVKINKFGGNKGSFEQAHH